MSGALRFAQGDPQSNRASEHAATGMHAFRFPVVVGTPTTTDVRANAALGDQRDAFSVPFAASDRAITDSVIESGATRTQASIPMALTSGGTLQVTLANSVVPQFAVAADRVMLGDALPLADGGVALTIAAALGRLRGPYRLTLAFDPATATAANLQALLSFQRSDGGFGAFANAAQSDPFTSAAALDALTFARARGVAVDAPSISKAADFMVQALANPGRFKWCANNALCKAQPRFEALWSLASAGRARTDFLADIVKQFDRLDSATEIRLTRYLLRTTGWKSQGGALADRLAQSLYVTGRYSIANIATRWAWRGSLVDAQSQMLQLLLERGAPAEQLDGALRALMAQRCRCGWATSDDSAAALVALSAYAARERLVPGAATASIGGRTIGTARFGSTASSQTFVVPASSLRGSSVVIRNEASAGRGAEGRVHYTVLYTYPVPPGAPGSSRRSE